jgi:8-oxo-dGTP pyrophosphatase MutT (NUDIX family)
VKSLLRDLLERYEPQSVEPAPGSVRAAVLILFYERDGEPHIVFQKRSEQVEAHKGQVSLPGGAMDPGDPDLLFTALRETHEEIGAHPSTIDVLGRLDDLQTLTNFAVTPYVGWLEGEADWRYHELEVAYLMEVPLSHLLDPSNFVPDRRLVAGIERVLPACQFESDLIWGITGRILANLLDLLATSEEWQGHPLPFR